MTDRMHWGDDPEGGEPEAARKPKFFSFRDPSGYSYTVEYKPPDEWERETEKWKRQWGNRKNPKDYGWVLSRLSLVPNAHAELDNCIHLTMKLGLTEGAGMIDILRAQWIARVSNRDVFDHSLEDFCRANIPIDMPPIDEKVRWRDELVHIATHVIDKGIALLKRFNFSAFWDQRFWARLACRYPDRVIIDDGISFLRVVFGGAFESEKTRLLARTLVDRFGGEEILPAEIIEGMDVCAESPITEDTANDPSMAADLSELRRILLFFIIAIEKGQPEPARWQSKRAKVFPISLSWGDRLIEEVRQGNRALLRDLRRLVPFIDPSGIEYESTGLYNTMAVILATHFPNTVISGLTQAKKFDRAEIERILASPFFKFLQGD